MSKRKLKRKPTQTFNISLTLPSDVPVMSEIKRLVLDGYSFGLAIKKVLIDWEPPVAEKVWSSEQVLQMMRTLAGANVETPVVNKHEEFEI